MGKFVISYEDGLALCLGLGFSSATNWDSDTVEKVRLTRKLKELAADETYDDLEVDEDLVEDTNERARLNALLVALRASKGSIETVVVSEDEDEEEEEEVVPKKSKVKPRRVVEDEEEEEDEEEVEEDEPDEDEEEEEEEPPVKRKPQKVVEEDDEEEEEEESEEDDITDAADLSDDEPDEEEEEEPPVRRKPLPASVEDDEEDEDEDEDEEEEPPVKRKPVTRSDDDEEEEDEEEEDEEDDEPKKPVRRRPRGKQKPGPEIAGKKFRRIHSLRNRFFCAGVVLRELGVDKGVTTKHVRAVDEMFCDGNPDQSNLKTSEDQFRVAWHVINGYLNG